MSNSNYSNSFYDGGLGGVGGHSSKKGATKGVCPYCGLSRLVSKNAWHRKCRPTCAKCGGLLEPSRKAQTNDPSLSCRAPLEPGDASAGIGRLQATEQRGQGSLGIERTGMKWYRLALSWDPTPNTIQAPDVDQSQPGISALPSSHPNVVPKRNKIKPGKKKNKIRWSPLGQAGSPAFPQDSARPNAASSDPHDLHSGGV